MTVILPPHLISPAMHGSAQVIKWIIRNTSSSAGPLPSIGVDVSTEIKLADTTDEFVVLEAGQFEEMQEFLTDPTIMSLFRLNFLRKLAPADAVNYISEIANLGAFQTLAREWCSQRSQTWSDLAEHLWVQAELTQDFLITRLRSSKAVNDSFSDMITDRFFFGTLGGPEVPEYIRLINELVQDGRRQRRIVDILHHCARRIKTVPNDEFLILGLQEDRAKFDELYVDRTLIDARTGEAVSSSDHLDIRQSCPRVVVIGDPGVGKSTLMSWARWRMVSSATQMPLSPAPVAITLVSRYDLIDANTTVLSAIRRHFEMEFLAECDEKLIAYLAATGWITLVVDGIDEISDMNQRRKVVDQLNSLAEAYPALPVICTTRRTGFEVGAFRTPLFAILQLENYSEEQVSEYAHRWFAASQSTLKAERFLGESQTLKDLTANPLLLALLCALYRQYDYIPESRRELYLRCAALMFYEWDPRRGISIPNLFKREGEAILREIALILLRKGGVGASIDEKQLLSIIKRHLEDKGQDSVAATAAARELLEYCSRRAWILSKVSSKDNLDYFSFTHRTFFEFFAAEATIRKLNHQHALAIHGQQNAVQGGDLGPVSRTILETFSADQTTVMPELLLQTADDLMGGMSTPVLDELLRVLPRSDRDRRVGITALCIRLVAAGGAHTGVVNRVLDAQTSVWLERGDLTERPSLLHDKPEDILSDLRALLNIAPSHRIRFIERCMNDINTLGKRFLQRYARLSIIGESGLYSDEWRECALVIMNLTAPSKDPFEVKYRWSSGLLPLEDAMRSTTGRNLLILTVDGHNIQGMLWDALGQQEASGVHSKILTRAFRSLVEDRDLLEDDIGDELVFFAERVHVVDGLSVPSKLAQAIAALMPRGEVDQWARIVGRPELIKLDALIPELEVVFRRLNSLRWVSTPWTARSRTEAERVTAKAEYAKANAEYARIAARYRRLCKEDPPQWLLDHLTPSKFASAR